MCLDWSVVLHSMMWFLFLPSFECLLGFEDLAIMNTVAMDILEVFLDVYLRAFLWGMHLGKGHRISICSALLNIFSKVPLCVSFLK